MFWIDVESSAGVKQGSGPITSGISWRYTRRLNRAGEWSLNLPAAEPRLTLATVKRHVHCYHKNPLIAWAGGGIIEDLRVSMSGQSPAMIVLSGPDILRELATTTVNFEVGYDNGPGRGLQIIDGIENSLPGWTFSIDGTVGELVARYVHQSALDALVAATNKLNLMWRLEGAGATGRPTRTLHIFDTAEDSGIVATNLGSPEEIRRNENACLITNIEQQQSGWELINQAVVFGAGEGQARLTLAAAADWPNGQSVTGNYTVTDFAGNSHTFVFDRTNNTITDSTSATEYGTYKSQIQFKEIGPVTDSDADLEAAADALVSATVSHLLNVSRPQEHYSLSVAGLQRIIQPGEQIRVVARRLADGLPYINIDKVLLVLETETQIDAEGSRITGLTVATTREFARTDGEVLVEQIRQIQAYTALPQMGPTENTYCYDSEIDASYPASFPFWLSRGTTIINSVIVRFKIDAFRSTAKTVGGLVEGTVNIPNHTHQVNTNGHTHTIEEHEHKIFVSKAGGAAVTIGFAGVDGFLTYGGGGGDPDTLEVLTNEQAGGTTSEGGAGGATTTQNDGATAGVELNLEGALSLVYGIYEDGFDTTYAMTDLTWTANAVTIAETPLAIEDGWFELDVTSYLVNSVTFRPLTYANAIEVSGNPAVDKRARLTVQIELRTVIQSIAAIA